MDRPGVLMRKSRVILILLAIAFSAHQSAAQTLAFSLFGRYLDSLREQAGIPAMSAAVVQNGTIVWEEGFGKADLEGNVAATPATPYLIGDLAQPLGSTILLRKCLDERDGDVTDRMVRWVPQFPESDTLVGHLLTHAAPGGGFQYSPARFAFLTHVVEQCAREEYGRLLADTFAQLGMAFSVPGHALDRDEFDSSELQRFDTVLRSLARSYRVDSRGRASRSEIAAQPADTSRGVISTVRDLARFDAALGAGSILDDSTRRMAWTRASVGGTTMPTGLGWFVQTYNNETVVWHFGLVADGYSSLIIKLPARGLTLILLANSDGLSAPYDLHKGDVTTSLFARLFLRLVFP